MDTVIEGKITADDGMSDIVQTVIALKNLQNAVLRITSGNDQVQGRIAFAQGGYILGGRMSNTDETGYPAVRKLLAVTDGNYAILDPGRAHITDINQTLWISASRVLDYLPTLPETPEIFLDGADVSTINTTVEKAQYDPMDLKVSASDNVDSKMVADKKSRTRTFDAANWRSLQVLFFLAFLLLVVLGGIQYWDQISAKLQDMLHPATQQQVQTPTQQTPAPQQTSTGN